MESHFFSHAEIDLGIETLIRPSYHQRGLEDQVHSVILPPSHGYNNEYDNNSDSLIQKHFCGSQTSLDQFFPAPVREEPLPEDDEQSQSQAVVVRGSDIGDLPTEYQVQGLKKHEYPVIGTFVHQDILPGFTYLVRKLDSERFLFKKKPLAVQRIGIGYGKRITFESELKNSNNNYFYSDTHPHGYGFSIVAISKGATFTVLDSEDSPSGEGVITEVGTQKEVSSHLRKNGDMVKMVAVTFSCDVRYGSNGHGLMPLFCEDTLELTGMAVVVKNKRARKAVTQSIEQLELPCLGTCTFQLGQ